MPNDYIYAVLSDNVYYNPTNNLPSEWKPFSGTFAPLNPSDDFYAFAYISMSLKKIIIAFRGSDIWKNYAADDIEIFFKMVPSLFLSKAIPFVEVVNREIIRQCPDFEISFTGHSLGAVLAELCAAKYSKKAVTFESPGSGGMIVDLALKGQLPLGAPVNAAANIFSYQAAISAINRYNAYLGTRYRLYPDLTYPDSPIVLNSVNLAGVVDDRCDPNDQPTHTHFIQYSRHQHQMKNLLTQFDPEEGAFVYSEYPVPVKSGYAYAFDTWLNYDENSYYWDQVINTYYPVCGAQQAKQAFKEAYIAKWLIRNTNPTQQTGITIYAPGSAHYPALTIWGTTNGKDTLLFGKGKFKVIAYGINTYKLTRDAQVSCDIEQMTLDSNRDSVLLVGDQSLQGYALHYNKTSEFPSTLYLSNGLKVLWDRVPGETKETYQISMGGHAMTAGSDFTTDFPMLHISNSPSGQFNILAGEAYPYGPNPYGLLQAASSKGFIYNLVGEDDGYGLNWILYQHTLLGEIISDDLLSSQYLTEECSGIVDKFSMPIQLYEKEGVLHVFSLDDCNKVIGPLPALTNHETNEEPESLLQCNKYLDILDNGKITLSCGGIYKCSEKNDFSLSLEFDNFAGSFQCSMGKKNNVLFMPSMQYPLKSGYKFVTNSHYFEDVDGSELSIMGENDAFILDNHNNRLFTFQSPLSNYPNHYYSPGAVLPNDDTLIMGRLIAPDYTYYAIYWETSSLVYFKSQEARPVPVTASTLLSVSTLLTTTEADFPKIGLYILLAVNMLLIGFIAQKATKHAYQRAIGFFSKEHQKNVFSKQDKNSDLECQVVPFNSEEKPADYRTFSEATPDRPSALSIFSICNKNRFARSSAASENDKAQNKKTCAVM